MSRCYISIWLSIVVNRVDKIGNVVTGVMRLKGYVNYMVLIAIQEHLYLTATGQKHLSFRTVIFDTGVAVVGIIG